MVHVIFFTELEKENEGYSLVITDDHSNCKNFDINLQELKYYNLFVLVDNYC